MPTLNADIETEVKELMGLFDLPAFARRGQEVEYSQQRLHERCRAMRGELLDMVRIRLRQWAGSVTGPDGWRGIFTDSIEPLWALSDAEEPRWAHSPAPSRRQLAIARDLIAAVLRFNARWARCLDQLNLEPVNHAIERYNRYYVLEKECVVGSARIAARHFVPIARIDRETLLQSHPNLPVPELLPPLAKGGSGGVILAQPIRGFSRSLFARLAAPFRPASEDGKAIHDVGGAGALTPPGPPFTRGRKEALVRFATGGKCARSGTGVNALGTLTALCTAPGSSGFASILSGFQSAVMFYATILAIGLNPYGAGPARAATDDSPNVARSPLSFQIERALPVPSGRLSARVYVFLERDESGLEPRNGPNWFRPEPFFAVDIESWEPNQPVRIGPRADGFPGRLDELRPGRYAVQAVVRLNRDTHRIGDGEGNAYGPVVHAEFDPKRGGTIKLKVDTLVAPRTFPATDRIKLVELPSPKLSAFYHRTIKHRAALILPEGLDRSSPDRKVAALYIIPGFGGDHFMARRYAGNSRFAIAKDFIRVVLDPDCGTGHHVFADSATNGPRGTALVEEFIPYIERTYPAIADPRARLLNGHSSGGWSSLWLQVAYPDFFGGTWSTSPDPVDFRDFQRIDIYAPGENMFRDRAGNRRPIARMGEVAALFYDNFSRMDDVIGWGGQLGSFEAVFSPVDPAGRPRKLWDRKTGAIDPIVASAWEKYDIRLVLERNWPALRPKLKGKLHVITGGVDTFYLEGAVALLKESLARLGSDAVVEIIPRRDHSTVMDQALARRLDREMHAAVGDLLPTGSRPGH